MSRVPPMPPIGPNYWTPALRAVVASAMERLKQSDRLRANGVDIVSLEPQSTGFDGGGRKDGKSFRFSVKIDLGDTSIPDHAAADLARAVEDRLADVPPTP